MVLVALKKTNKLIYRWFRISYPFKSYNQKTNRFFIVLAIFRKKNSAIALVPMERFKPKTTIYINFKVPSIQKYNSLKYFVFLYVYIYI